MRVHASSLSLLLVSLLVSAAFGANADGPGARLDLDAARTLVLGIEIDREGARLLAYTLKDRPFRLDSELPAARAHDDEAVVQAEVVLHGPDGLALTRRVDVGALCLGHGPETEPHVAGDTIRPHRDSFLVELPELPGFDRVEVALYDRERGELNRRSLGRIQLDRAAFLPAAAPLSYTDLAFADDAADEPTQPVSSGDVIWPEDVGDPDVYRVWGDPAEAAERINITIVPDGYLYEDKAILQTHANQLVQFFRWKTPFAEHDRFINYTLVYAYSRERGTDECDCNQIRDTAMGSGFPDRGAPCGDMANRCLYYAVGCDGDQTANIVAAELRAPAHDYTLLMVNSARYGGCGGVRAVFSFLHLQAPYIAVHEFGHTMAWLADEYGGDPGCGTRASEMNTSIVPYYGAWPEWVPEIGPAWEGAQYYDHCVYRPVMACAMKDQLQQFCPVCNQRWARVIFAHPRVNPTAPLAYSVPPSPVGAFVGVPLLFWVQTRLAVGPSVTNEFEWLVQGPADPEPLPVFSGKPELSYTFTETGSFTVTCRITADTNFIKPVKYGANVDEAVWTVDVSTLAVPEEVSAPGSAQPLLFTGAQSVAWEDAAALGAWSYNLYRGDLAALAAGEYGLCEQAAVEANQTDIGPAPPVGTAWFYLVSGTNPSGEGPLGQDPQDLPRLPADPCE